MSATPQGPGTAPGTPDSLVLKVWGLATPGPAAPWLRDLHADIHPGITLVTGDEGCGKTSLLRLLAGETRAGQGHIRLNDWHLPGDLGVWRQQVFWVEAHETRFDGLTPLQFLDQMAAQYPLFDPQVVAALLDPLGLTDHLHKPLYMLSTGSRRKVALVAAAASSAPLTLLDHPLAALDAPSARIVCQGLAHEAQARKRIWLVADHEAPPDVPLRAIWTLPSA